MKCMRGEWRERGGDKDYGEAEKFHGADLRWTAYV